MLLIDKDLINKELSDGSTYHKLKLSNKLLDKLSNQYECVEMVENFYDREPEFEGEDDELFNMYLDYKDSIEFTGLTFWKVYSKTAESNMSKTFSENPHTREELREAYLKVTQMYKDFEETRLKCLTWQEPYFEGNWGMTQHYVDTLAKKILKQIKKSNINKSERFYWSKEDEYIKIYFYGRDYSQSDYWFIFRKRKKT